MSVEGDARLPPQGRQCRLRMNEAKTTSKLAAAGAERLARMEEAAMASGRWGPLVVMGRRIGRHELIDRGAALTYYSVLSLIPGLLVLFSVIGLVGDQGTVNEVVNIVDDVGPSNADAAAKSSLESLISDDTQSGTLLGVGLLAVLWTASAYIGCFFRASAEIWGVERRPVWRAWPLRVALTTLFLLLLAIALMIIVLTGELASSVGDAIGIEDQLIRAVLLPQVAGVAGRRHTAGRAALPLVAEPRAIRDRLARTHTRGRGFGGGLDPRLGRLRGLRERVRHIRRHVRRARHHDRRASCGCGSPT